VKRYNVICDLCSFMIVYDLLWSVIIVCGRYDHLCTTVYEFTNLDKKNSSSFFFLEKKHTENNRSTDHAINHISAILLPLSAPPALPLFPPKPLPAIPHAPLRLPLPLPTIQPLAPTHSLTLSPPLSLQFSP
jgi:hypothetical protein